MAKVKRNVYGNVVTASWDDYVADPTLPAGPGWCEAVVTPQKYTGDTEERHCQTTGRYERDGHRVCGLHLKMMKGPKWR